MHVSLELDVVPELRRGIGQWAASERETIFRNASALKSGQWTDSEKGKAWVTESEKSRACGIPHCIAVVDIRKLRLLGQGIAITSCAIIDQNLDFDIMQEPLVLIGFTMTIHQSRLGSTARLPRPAVSGSCVLY